LTASASLDPIAAMAETVATISPAAMVESVAPAVRRAAPVDSPRRGVGPRRTVGVPWRYRVPGGCRRTGRVTTGRRAVT
jgi:hypothetical protein